MDRCGRAPGAGVARPGRGARDPVVAASRRARPPAPAAIGAGLALAALPLLLGADRLHTELKSSHPAKDTVLAESPDTITLTYTTDVQLALSTVVVRPAGVDAAPMPAGELAYLADDRRDVLALPLIEPLARGDYSVSWVTAGPDGHRLSDDFGFRVESASGPAADSDAPLAAGGNARVDGDSGRPSAVASLDGGQTLARFWLYAGIVAVLGGVVFRVLVLGACARAGESAGAIDAATRRTRVVLAAGLGVLLAVAPARLWVQADALFPGDAAGNFGTVLTGTPWAVGWWLQVAGTVLVAAGMLIPGRQGAGRPRWGVVAAGALLLPLAPLLSGHGWADSPRVLSAAATYLHVVAAGGWMGGLACLLVAGLPALRGHGGDANAGAPGLAGMVGAFSRVAQSAVAVLLLTGAIKVWLHIDAASELWTTAWGRTLLVKDVFVVGVLALGLYNWRVVRPALAEDPRPGRLRRPALVELLIGAAVVAVTSFLVGRPLG